MAEVQNLGDDGTIDPAVAELFGFCIINLDRLGRMKWTFGPLRKA